MITQDFNEAEEPSPWPEEPEVFAFYYNPQDPRAFLYVRPTVFCFGCYSKGCFDGAYSRMWTCNLGRPAGAAAAIAVPFVLLLLWLLLLALLRLT